MDGLRYAAGLGLPLRVAMTATPENGGEVEALRMMLSAIGIDGEDFAVRPLVRRGFAADASAAGAIEVSDAVMVPELTITADGAHWHPVGADMRPRPTSSSRAARSRWRGQAADRRALPRAAPGGRLAARRVRLRGVTGLETDRLLLRPWRDADRDAFAAMSADPEVMEFFPAELSGARRATRSSTALGGIAERGWGWFAVEERASGAFAGVAGLAPVRFEAHFTPAVEIGWRLARAAWGQGFATEAARAAVAFAFGELGLDEVVALAVPANARSLAVMRRLGMTHDPADDFDHPTCPPTARCAATSSTA